MPFKIEFSRRNEPLEADAHVTTVDFSPWGIHESSNIYHYSLKSLFEQKIEALLSEGRMASRDVFDLHYITGLATRTGTELTLPSGRSTKSIEEKIYEFSEDQINEELLPYLSSEMQESFDYTTLVVSLNDRIKGIEVFTRTKNISSSPRTPRL